MKKKGFRGWRKMARDKEAWHVILREARVLRGLEEKKKF
jgi:hypothetical protein